MSLVDFLGLKVEEIEDSKKKACGIAVNANTQVIRRSERLTVSNFFRWSLLKKVVTTPKDKILFATKYSVYDAAFTWPNLESKIYDGVSENQQY